MKVKSITPFYSCPKVNSASGTKDAENTSTCPINNSQHWRGLTQAQSWSFKASVISCRQMRSEEDVYPEPYTENDSAEDSKSDRGYNPYAHENRQFSHELLSREDEVALAYIIKHGSEEEAEEARKRFADCNQRLVMKAAKKYLGRGVSLAELLQEGNSGLMRAINDFDETLGNRFSTYGMKWIEQRMGSATKNSSIIHEPPQRQEERFRREKIFNRFKREHGRMPDDNEYAKLRAPAKSKIEAYLYYEDYCKAGLRNYDSTAIDSVKKRLDKQYGELPISDTAEIIYEELIKLHKKRFQQDAPKTLSIDMPINDDGDTVSYAVTQDNVLEHALNKEMYQRISNIVDTIRSGVKLHNQQDPKTQEHDTHRMIYRLRRGFEDRKYTLEEIADIYGVTRERIRQIEVKAEQNLNLRLMRLTHTQGEEAIIEGNIPELPDDLVVKRVKDVITTTLVGSEKEIILNLCGFKTTSQSLRQLHEESELSRSKLTRDKQHALEKMTEPIKKLYDSLQPRNSLPKEFSTLLESCFSINSLLKRVEGKPQEAEIKEHMRKIITNNISTEHRSTLLYHFGIDNTLKGDTSVAQNTAAGLVAWSALDARTRECMTKQLMRLYNSYEPEVFKTIETSSLEQILEKMTQEPMRYKYMFHNIERFLEEYNFTKEERDIMYLRWALNKTGAPLTNEEIQASLCIGAEKIRRTEKMAVDVLSAPIIEIHNKIYADSKLPLPQQSIADCSTDDNIDTVSVIQPPVESGKKSKNTIVEELRNIIEKKLKVEEEKELILHLFGFENQDYKPIELRKKLNLSKEKAYNLRMRALEKIRIPLEQLHSELPKGQIIPTQMQHLLEQCYSIPMILKKAKGKPQEQEIKDEIREIVETIVTDGRKNIIIDNFNLREGAEGGMKHSGAAVKSLASLDSNQRKFIAQELQQLFKSYESTLSKPRRKSHDS